MTEICIVSTFTDVRQTCFAYNIFLGAFFNNFFNEFEISMKFSVFWYLFWFVKKNLLGVIILAIFENIETKRAKKGSKNWKTYFVKVF